MEAKRRPIGVFDSGVGGVSVLRELVKLMPGENYLYFGDSANAPYGEKTTPQVQELTLAAAKAMVEKGVKAMVIARNTATSAAIHLLRAQYPDMVVIGIEPALKVAADMYPEGRIGVMATSVTLREEKFRNQTERFPNARIYPIPAPGLVEQIESGKLRDDSTRALLESLLLPYQNQLDALVLGCTHYPFAAELIGEILGPGTVLLDGGAGTARQTKRCLEAAGLLFEGPGSVTFESSSEDGRITELCARLLKEW